MHHRESKVNAKMVPICVRLLIRIESGFLCVLSL